MPRNPRRFVLAPALQEILLATLQPRAEAHLKSWLEEIAKGDVGEETRSIILDLGYLSSSSDPRCREAEPVKVKP
jgi:hypothetical protein